MGQLAQSPGLCAPWHNQIAAFVAGATPAGVRHSSPRTSRWGHLSPGLGDGTPAMCGLDTPRLGQKVSQEPPAVASPGLCSAAAVACSWLRSPKGVDRNSELKQRLQLWELGQVSVLMARSGWRAQQTGAERDEGAGMEQNRHRLVAPRQTVANECSWSHWRTARTPGCHCLLHRRWSEEAPVPAR